MPQSGTWNATTLLKLAKLAQTSGPRSSDLQKLLQNLPANEFSTPSSGAWNIRETVVSSTPSSAGPQTVTIRTTDLQQLLEKTPTESSTPSTLWNIRGNPRQPKVDVESIDLASIKSSELQDLLVLHGLADKRPATVWDIKQTTARPVPPQSTELQTSLRYILSKSHTHLIGSIYVSRQVFP